LEVFRIQNDLLFEICR